MNLPRMLFQLPHEISRSELRHPALPLSRWPWRLFSMTINASTPSTKSLFSSEDQSFLLGSSLSSSFTHFYLVYDFNDWFAIIFIGACLLPSYFGRFDFSKLLDSQDFDSWLANLIKFSQAFDIYWIGTIGIL